MARSLIFYAALVNATYVPPRMPPFTVATALPASSIPARGDAVTREIFCAQSNLMSTDQSHTTADHHMHHHLEKILTKVSDTQPNFIGDNPSVLVAITSHCANLEHA